MNVVNINILNMYESFNSVNSNRYKQNSNQAKDTGIGHCRKRAPPQGLRNSWGIHMRIQVSHVRFRPGKSYIEVIEN